ncbi:HAD family hydrolase [Alkalibacillus haloalkaliphilus]|uniref:Haloacid dehalogenase n=1 Tax=Alkalibacillus haloalkaliphilus TaxID=94136 RepID=A0A511W5R3_9BACI|nr:HAD family hydrolase [Alkalibacillus haloalkaliphilus]GEN45383.1 haloacid dehalogenase [Alkalibacillus haloalkaliphilus]
MIKAVVFDLDRTLLDRDKSVRVFIEKQHDRLNTFLDHIPKEKYITRFIELDQRGYVSKDKVYQQIVDEFNITGLTWQELLEDYISRFKDSCRPFPNLNRMLETLLGHHLILGVITNGRGQFQLDNIKALGIEHYFESILISEWEGVKKPDPQIFYKALEALDVVPAESIYVGDHPENDIKASRNVGMKSVWMKDKRYDGVQADFVIEDLMEVPYIVEGLCSRRI